MSCLRETITIMPDIIFYTVGFVCKVGQAYISTIC